jgi:diadenosine tetraphosphatase ApaH/serine/threonine PP2A family protein phosphatase
VDPYCAEQFNGAARQAIFWTRENIGPLHLNALNRLPATASIGEHVMCVHASPVPGPTDYVHDKQVAAMAFRGVDRQVCLIGHTHIPMVFEAPTTNPDDQFTAPELIAYVTNDSSTIELMPDRRYICNPGSVGQPRDCDPRASFAMLELDDNDVPRTFTVYRQVYDVAAAQKATQRAGLPNVLAERLALGA